MKKVLLIAFLLQAFSSLYAAPLHTGCVKPDIIIEIVASQLTATPNNYTSANSVTVQLLDSGNRALASAQTTPNHAVTFTLSGQERKVRAIYFFDGGQYIIMDEEMQ